MNLKTGLQRMAGTEGMAAVEFAIILSVFLMLLLGIVEFGYDWYVRHLITNASRDGVRYGVMYKVDGAGNRISPSQFGARGFQTIQQVVNANLTGLLPDGSWSVPTPSGTGYGSGNPGDPLTVQVTFTKNWSALGGFIPSLSSGMTITVQTTMNLE